MKFGISNVFVLCAILLSVDTFAAPVQIIDARDESSLAVRTVPKKAPIVKAAPKPVVPKPAAVPKPAPVTTAPKKVPVAAAPKKAPVATPPKKAPVATPPKKAPVATPPKKAPVATPPKAPVVTAPNKTAPKPVTAAPKPGAAAPKPNASAATCSFGSNSKTTKPKTIKGRVVATTQFHATCKDFAASIKSAVEGGTFALQPERIWPNEFTWSGGFYVTPDKADAVAFGATFLQDKCATKGGVVVMEFTLNQSALKVQEVSSAEVIKFRSNMSKLGFAIQRIIKPKPPANATPADPPADQNISTDDNPTVEAPLIALPTQEQLDTIETNAKKALSLAQVQLLKEFRTVDVVAGATSLTSSQQILAKDAVGVGLPPISEPFKQVVLVTDKAMKALTFVAVSDLPTCLADKRPLLEQAVKERVAKAEKEFEDSEAANKAGRGGFSQS